MRLHHNMLGAAVVGIVVMGTMPTAFAASKSYVGADGGNFNVNGNWTPANVPANGDNVTLGDMNPTNSTDTNFSVTLNSTEPATGTYNSLTLSSSKMPGFIILNQIGGTLSVRNHRNRWPEYQ